MLVLYVFHTSEMTDLKPKLSLGSVTPMGFILNFAFSSTFSSVIIDIYEFGGLQTMKITLTCNYAFIFKCSRRIGKNKLN